MKNKQKDILVVGFALFAMFFGAGNLIFPPYLGVVSGTSWTIGFTGFIIADVGLALLAILASAKCGGDINQVIGRSGKILAMILATAITVCIGPLLAIPRTGATTFEMGIQPIFNGFNPIIFSVIFFGLTLVLTIKPSKVVDIIGQYLTPALLIALIVLIIKGIVSPLGDLTQLAKIDGVFAEGISQGYQTMDPLAALALSSVVIISLGQKGYTNQSQKIKLTLSAGIVAGIALFIIYAGLTFLGFTVAGQFIDVNVSDINQTALIVSITEQLLGEPGKILLSVIVILACLTTAIGLTSATAQYFTKISKGRIKYEVTVIAVCIFSAVVSNFGVSTIISFSAPILSIVYPVTIVLVMLTLFGKNIHNDNIFKGATYTALVVSVITVMDSLGIKVDFIHYLPFDSIGFNWIIPAIIGGLIGKFIPSKKSENYEKYIRKI